MHPKESELIKKINELASPEFELIVIDKTTGIAYRRNTDWEWAGEVYITRLAKLAASS